MKIFLRGAGSAGLSLIIALIFISYSAGISQVDAENVPQTQDSIPKFSLETIVITADRIENKVANSTSSVSVMRAADIQRLPLEKFSDLFSFIPGFFVVNMDGIGRNASINARGFYGGGEAEYNIVLLDGKQINDLETGLVNWNLVPLKNIESVEIARGTSSPLYGDAAFGSVVNIITRAENAPRTALSLEGGSYGSINAGGRTRGMWDDRPYQLFLSNERTHGFRSHSTWQGTNVGGDLLLPIDESSGVRLSTMNQWVNFDDAGPLTEQEVLVDRRGSSVYYRNDGKDERRHQFQADYNRTLSEAAAVKAGLFYKFKHGTSTRTFTNPSPILDQSFNFTMDLYDTTQYGDTKERDLSTDQAGLNLQFTMTNESENVQNRVLVGFDGDYGHLTSTYYNAFAGFEENYASTASTRGAAVSAGKNSRTKYAFYVKNEVRVFDRLTLSAGARFDGISDKYTGSLPRDTTIRARSHAFSPKVGMNFQYLTPPEFIGSIYASVNRSFKAATLDQLSDQRPIDVMFFVQDGAGGYFMFPFSQSPFSNGTLRPQRGTSYEVGIYQRFKYLQQSFGEFSLSVYQIDLKDEIDFDFATFKYQNINESRHQGVEIGLTMYWLPNLMTFVNETWTDATFRSGPSVGNYLKSIPRKTASVGIAYDHDSGVKGSLTWSFVNKIFIDDANTVVLPNYSFGSVRLGYTVSMVNLFIDVQNLLDRKFSTTGYVNPNNMVTYLFPAAGRVFRGGISVDL